MRRPTNVPTHGECACSAMAADECECICCPEGVTRRRCGLLPDYCGHVFCWRFGVVVARKFRLTKLTYAEPGY